MRILGIKQLCGWLRGYGSGPSMWRLYQYHPRVIFQTHLGNIYYGGQKLCESTFIVISTSVCLDSKLFLGIDVIVVGICSKDFGILGGGGALFESFHKFLMKKEKAQIVKKKVNK